MPGPEDDSPAAQPALPRDLPPEADASTPDPLAGLDEEYPDIESVTLVDEDVALHSARTVSLLRTRMRAGRLRFDPETPVDVCDAVLTDVDLSGLRVGGLTRVVLERCRLTGCEFADTTIRDVSFSDCALDMVGARSAQLERVTIHGGRIDGLDLTRATLTDVSIGGVRLSEATIDGLWCVRVDLTDAELAGADLSVLRGATITAQQAMQLSLRLAKGLGIHVALTEADEPGP